MRLMPAPCRHANRTVRSSVTALTPREQGVIDGQLRGELLLVVVVGKAKALGDGHQPARLGREVALVRVGASDDQRQSVQGRLLLDKPVATNDRVERALVAVVPKLGAGNVVWRGTFTIGNSGDLVARDIQELGLVVHEALDEPWTGDAIDLRPLTGYPLHSSPPS